MCVCCTVKHAAGHDAHGDGREDSEEYSQKLPTEVDEGSAVDQRAGHAHAR